jgi:CDP-diacylglycerol--glycerol-3-phosphate 3-phosphatidyltransferase
MKTAECPPVSTQVSPVRLRINLPNQITILRLVLAVIFFACLAQFQARGAVPRIWLLDLCAVLFTAAAISDIVDGYLARKHNQVTSFGRVIDPFVDKILVIGAYIFLAGDGFINSAGVKISDVSGWMVVVILGRELLVTSLRGVTEAGGKSFAANLYGKAKMVLQSITVVWVLLTVAHPEFFGFFFVYGRSVMLHLTVAVTFLSMIPYLWSARDVLMQMSVTPK